MALKSQLMTTLEHDLADYVRTLEQCSNSTHRAEDRPLYEAYLADAAGFLAAVALGATADETRERFQRHERLWGTTWLIDPVSESAASKWTVIRERLNRGAI
jgi:hypothetical protein